MRIRGTIILLILALLVGVYIAVFEADFLKDENSDADEGRVFRFDAAKVSRIALESDAPMVECVREKEGWFLRKPVWAWADQERINGFLYAMESLQHGEVITSEEIQGHGLSLVDYGLEKPRIRISVTTDGRQGGLLVGRTAPLGDRVYVRMEDSTDVLAVPTSFLAAIPSHPETWRDRCLFRGDPARVKRINVHRPDGFVQLSRSDGGDWTIQQPINAGADASAVNKLLQALFALRIESFVADGVKDPTAYGAPEDVVSVTLWNNGDEKGQTLLIGTPVEDDPARVYAKTDESQSIYALPSEVLKLLDLNITSLRDRQLLPFAPDDIIEVSIEKGENVLTLEKEASHQWKVSQPIPGVADGRRVLDLLESWCEARILDYAEPPATNQAVDAAFTSDVALVFKRNDISEERAEGVRMDFAPTRVAIQTVPSDDGKINLKLDADNTVYRIRSDIMDSVSLNPLFYRDRRVLGLRPESIRSITIIRGGQEQQVTRPDGMREFAGAGTNTHLLINTNALLDLVRLLSNLEVTEFLVHNPRNLEEYGLDAPETELIVGLSGEEGISKVVLLGDDASTSTVYAMIRGQDLVFRLDKDAASTLTGDLYLADKQPGSNVETDRFGTGP